MDTKDHVNQTNGFFFKDFSSAYIPQILKEIYIDRIYHPFLIGKRDAIILDVGGNIGLTSFYFKDYAKQVFALEPAKQHVDCFDKMLYQNKIKNVKLIQKALSNNNGTTKFFHNDNTTMFSLESVVNNVKDYEEVETVTIDTLFEEEKIKNIDFMKLDTEGHESQILSSDGFKKVAPLIKVMVMEWHSWTAMSVINIVSLLTDLGFEVRRIPSEATILSAVRL